MPLSVRVAASGPDAADALRHAVQAAKGDDPLRPVTIVVANGRAGLATRRRLGDSAGPAGIAAVTCTTLARLAERLGGPALSAAGRRPASTTVLHAAARAALAGHHGLLAPVRSHPATEIALVRAARDLRGASAGSLARLRSQSARAAAVVELTAAMGELLAGWYDDHELHEAAAATARRQLPADVGSVVVHLPPALSPVEAALVRALGSTTDVVLIAGVCGDADVDTAHVLGLCQAVGLEPPPVPSVPLPHAATVVSAPAADVEVLLAVRRVAAALAEGRPLDRIAIAHGGTEPYPRLLLEALAAAGVPANGPGVRSLDRTVGGRCLLRALLLPDRGWRRDDVLGWVAGGPVVESAGGRSAAAWERISRAAGVTGGLDSWRAHLGGWVVAREARAAEVDGQGDPERAAGIRRDIERARQLGALVDDLARRLDPDDHPVSWRGWRAWAESFLRWALGGPRRWDTWPEEERHAMAELLGALARLGALDPLEPAPDLGTFRRALEVELAAPAPTTARFGHGVLVLPVALVAGLDLDEVIVVGMADGAFPHHRRPDAVLPDHEREAAGPDIPRTGAPGPEQRRAFLGALASAPNRWVSFSRGDLRSGRELRASRWLLESAAALAGVAHLATASLAEPGALDATPGVVFVRSAIGAVAADGEPASLADRDRGSMLRWLADDRPIEHHPLSTSDPVLRAGLRARRHRRSARFTRFDGRVGARVPVAGGDGRPLSPTALESYAACPRRYLLDRVLHVQATERPEAVERIRPLDRGRVVHEVLERFVRDEVDRPEADRLPAGAPWTAEHHRRLDAIADEVFALVEQQGLAGRPLYWTLDRRAVRRDLHELLRADDRYRETTGARPVAVELSFGDSDDDRVTVDLPGGRALPVHGFIDRVDLDRAGRAWVLDYKDARADRYAAIEGDDPVERGTRLQLAIYGLAARQLLGADDVEARYWFVRPSDGYRQVGYPLDDTRLDRFGEVLSTIVDGIESGHFPARPGDEDSFTGHANCRFCAFDRLCPTGRGRDWERLRDDPDLAAYRRLAEPDPPADEPGDDGPWPSTAATP